MTAVDRRPRTVRSYVLRAGRITVAQRRALDDLWPRFGVEFTPTPLDLGQVFGRAAPRVLEIGFGNGELLVAMAAAAPERDFLGLEVHEPGIGHCLLEIARRELTNVRLIRHDAVEVLQHQILSGSLALVQLMFPDPWPKKRHHKRRIVQPSFMDQVVRALGKGGEFHVATDWPPYAEHIAAVVAQRADLVPTAAAGPPSDPQSGAPRPSTRFERRGARLGHPVWEARFMKTGSSTAAPSAL